MAGYRSSGFEIPQRFDARAYPAQRLKREGPPVGGGGPPALSPTGSAVGRTRVFPWIINETAGSRRTISTPKLLGNVVINSFYFATSTIADPPNETIEVGWAPGPVDEAGVALTVPRPYTVLTELLDPFGQIANDRGAGFPSNTRNSPNRGTRIPLGLVVMERELAVCVAIVNPSGFAQVWNGYISVTENLSLAALAGYIPAA